MLKRRHLAPANTPKPARRPTRAKVHLAADCSRLASAKENLMLLARRLISGMVPAALWAEPPSINLANALLLTPKPAARLMRGLLPPATANIPLVNVSRSTPKPAPAKAKKVSAAIVGANTPPANAKAATKPAPADTAAWAAPAQPTAAKNTPLVWRTAAALTDTPVRE